MLVNLLVSSIRAISEGEIKIQVQMETLTDKDINAHFKITNSRQFIAEEDLPKVFEPYSNAG
jgi:signal transduction histidine kinase